VGGIFFGGVIGATLARGTAVKLGTAYMLGIAELLGARQVTPGDLGTLAS